MMPFNEALTKAFFTGAADLLKRNNCIPFIVIYGNKEGSYGIIHSPSITDDDVTGMLKDCMEGQAAGTGKIEKRAYKVKI